MAKVQRKPFQFGLKWLFWLTLAASLLFGFPWLAWLVLFIAFVAAWVSLGAFAGHQLADWIEWMDRGKRRDE